MLRSSYRTADLRRWSKQDPSKRWKTFTQQDCPSPNTCVTFRYILFSLRINQLLAVNRIPNVEDYPLSTLKGFLFPLSYVILHISYFHCISSVLNLMTCSFVMIRNLVISVTIYKPSRNCAYLKLSISRGINYFTILIPATAQQYTYTIRSCYKYVIIRVSAYTDHLQKVVIKGMSNCG